MPDETLTLEERIRERAYHLWAGAGCPQGRDEEFWFLARDVETGSLPGSPVSAGPTPAEEQLMAEAHMDSGPTSG